MSAGAAPERAIALGEALASGAGGPFDLVDGPTQRAVGRLRLVFVGDRTSGGEPPSGLGNVLGDVRFTPSREQFLLHHATRQIPVGLDQCRQSLAVSVRCHGRDLRAQAGGIRRCLDGQSRETLTRFPSPRGVRIDGQVPLPRPASRPGKWSASSASARLKSASCRSGDFSRASSMASRAAGTSSSWVSRPSAAASSRSVAALLSARASRAAPSSLKSSAASGSAATALIKVATPGSTRPPSTCSAPIAASSWALGASGIGPRSSAATR